MIRQWLMSSYRSDPIAFAAEMAAFKFAATASIWLAITAKQPNMILLYPIYLMSSLLGTYANWRRKLVWPMLLTLFFSTMNIIGWFNAAS
jgi:nicotinamide riboside transporter PnuC